MQPLVYSYLFYPFSISNYAVQSLISYREKKEEGVLENHFVNCTRQRHSRLTVQIKQITSNNHFSYCIFGEEKKKLWNFPNLFITTEITPKKLENKHPTAQIIERVKRRVPLWLLIERRDWRSKVQLRATGHATTQSRRNSIWIRFTIVAHNV